MILLALVFGIYIIQKIVVFFTSLSKGKEIKPYSALEMVCDLCSFGVLVIHGLLFSKVISNESLAYNIIGVLSAIFVVGNYRIEKRK